MSREALPPDMYAAMCRYVIVRDGWRCRACKHRNNLHVHHIVYRSQQGPDTKENCALLCNDCHDAVHKGTIRVVGDNADIPGNLKFLRIPKCNQ